LQRAIADLLSTNNFTFLGSSPTISPSNLLSQIAWQDSVEAAMYSASQLEMATIFCFYEAQVTSLDPRRNTRPDVLFRSSKSPAKSLSLKPVMTSKPVLDLYTTKI
jgi:hypothetical protein